MLIVDDSASVRSRVAALLRDAGLDVVGEAATAAQARRLARSLHPDVIVLDLALPDGSGMELLPLLKADEPATAIAVLTGTAMESVRRRCLELGADWFFDKARDFDALGPALAAGAEHAVPANRGR